MKRVTMLLLLTLTVSLSAIVNLGDEYIGPEPMGQFRKTYYCSGSSCMYYYEDTTFHYYYDEVIPNRLTLIQSCHDNIDFTTYSKQIYEYQDFDDYRKVIESYYYKDWDYYWEEGGYVLQYITTYTYNLQDKLLEQKTAYYESDGTEDGIRRTVYGYDDNGNLALVVTYHSGTSETAPSETATYDYDAQNRLVHSEKKRNGHTVYELWQTWGNHSLPDSTYTRDGVYRTIQKNFFDSNEVRYLSKVWKSWSEEPWERTDTYYQYVTAHQMHFPLMQSRFIGQVDGVDGAFEPESTFTMNYFYTDDYHKVTVSKFHDDTDDVYNDNYIYDDNWMLTKKVRREGYWFSTLTSTQDYTWEYYGPTHSDDPTAAPQALVSAYPNPARGNVNISLSKSSASVPVEAKVYNIKGQLVRSLTVSETRSDQYLYNWDCKDRNNRAVPAGVYLIRIKTQGGEVSKKVTVLR